MAQEWELYGKKWDPSWSRIDVEVWCIQQGEDYLKKEGRTLLFHYRELQSLLWPDYEHTLWSDLILKTMLEERITVVMGPKDSGKTNTMARFGLVDYLCFPNVTLAIMSSTELRGLQLRVWGEVKTLFNQGRETWPEQPGFAVDSMYGIFTDEIKDTGEARDIRKGITCIPVVDSEGQWTGMRRWVGVKQKRRRIFADELQFYPEPYLSTLSNLDKGNFKFCGCGNPIGNNDPLDKMAEPADGWDSLPEITTTTVWRNRFGGVTINLVGTDSPAIKFPGKFPYLINQGDIDRIIQYWGKDSSEFWNQAMGVRRPGVSVRRVVTRDMAKQFGAMNSVVWRGKETTKIFGLDAAYGGDRCIGIVGEFGEDINDIEVFSVSSPMLVPVKVYPKGTPESERFIAEDQIATFVKAECEKQGIPPANVFYDATGRGSLGTSFARIWSADVNPLEFGGAPSPNPVCADLFILDEKTKERRLKRADEHYSKRVTELWFAIRYCIESRQMRNLPEDVLDELAAREWTEVKGNKKELESKEDMKPRFGKSPDKADALATCLFGAIRRGFKIRRFILQNEDRDDTWKIDLMLRAKKFRASYQLTR